MDAQYRINIERPVSRPVLPESSGSASGMQIGTDGVSWETSPCPSPAKCLWKKAIAVAKQAQRYDSDSEDSEIDESLSISDEPEVAAEKKIQREQTREERARKRQERITRSKAMDRQYFLEMIDTKHRYGANLRAYHEVWMDSDTHENFFYWLDQGGGREIDLAMVPRERLERERIRYLSREERRAYLVKIDHEGRLCWDRTGERIDTSKEYINSTNGVVHVSEVETGAAELSTPCPCHTLSAPVARGHKPDQQNRNGKDQDSPRKFKTAFRFSGQAILDKLLRCSVQENTWIFVADVSFRLYVGIKDSGSFQHSSFLQGSRVSAAGSIKIKDGKLVGLSPLSGHYRPTASNFRAFMQSLREAGVDMENVVISKSLAVVQGIELYSKLRKGMKRFGTCSNKT